MSLFLMQLQSARVDANRIRGTGRCWRNLSTCTTKSVIQASSLSTNGNAGAWRDTFIPEKMIVTGASKRIGTFFGKGGLVSFRYFNGRCKWLSELGAPA